MATQKTRSKRPPTDATSGLQGNKITTEKAEVEAESLDNSMINKLSNEILIKIFKYLDVNSRKTSSLVCKRWLDVVFIPELCKDFPLTFVHCLFRPKTKPMMIFNKTGRTRNFPYVTIGNLQENKFKIGTNEEDEARALKVIKKITHGTTHLKLLENAPANILECFPNLKVLEVKNLLRCPSLSHLSATVHTIIVKNLSNGKYENLKYLTNVKTLNCKAFYLDPKETEPLVEVSDELKNVLIKGSGISKTVKTSSNLLSGKIFTFEDVTGLCFEKKFNDPKSILKFPNLNSIEVNDVKCIRFHCKLKMVTMKTLKISSEYYHHKFCRHCFIKMVKSFPNIENLSANFKIKHNEMKLVFRSYPKLKKLEAYIENLKKITIYPKNPDKVGIEALKDLEHLVFVDTVEDQPDEDDTTVLDWRVLSNWPFMPKLKTLALGRISVSNPAKVFEKFTKQVPNVRHCHIRAEGLCDEAVKVLTKAWPTLLSLKLEVFADLYTIFDTKFIHKNCQQLQYLSCDSWAATWERFDLEWMFYMYRNIQSLREIKLFVQKANIFDGDSIETTRTCVYSQKKIREILKIGQARFDEIFRNDEYGYHESEALQLIENPYMDSGPEIDLSDSDTE